ncbi:TPA: hypothetical protein MC918_004457 [Klebsiella pneumoniae]|nr:MAG: hypothetical protein [Bacteriophage sp.]HBU7917283.1 hypothetical protein [Klebsiella pneumoniae]
MKMIAADYDLLRALVIRVVDYNKAPDETPAQFVERYAEHMQVKHPNIKDKFKACRWQLFHAAVRQPTEFDGQRFTGKSSSMLGFYGKLSAYLNDDHIDTALRQIVKEIAR